MWEKWEREKYAWKVTDGNKRHHEKSKIIKILKEDRMRTPDQNLLLYEKQLKEYAEFFFKIKITCADCNKKTPFFKLFRCYKCGLYLCSDCCPKHFDMKKPERLQTLRRKKNAVKKS